ARGRTRTSRAARRGPDGRAISAAPSSTATEGTFASEGKPCEPPQAVPQLTQADLHLPHDAAAIQRPDRSEFDNYLFVRGIAQPLRAGLRETVIAACELARQPLRLPIACFSCHPD